MPVALVAGAFGQGNLGDDALLESFVAALPGWELTVTAPPHETAKRFGCRSVSPSSPAAVGRALQKADAVIVGGGTVFKTVHPATDRHRHGLLATASALTAASSALRRPVAMVGVGVGDLGDGRARAMARFIVRHSDLLILRDDESARALLQVGAAGPFRVGADPAWTLLRPLDACTGRDASVRVIPSWLAASADGLGELGDRLLVTLGALVSRGVRVQLQPWQHRGGWHPDDGELIRAVARQLGSSVEILERPATLQDAAESMTGVGAVLTFRFHAMLAAAAAGVPTVAVAHEAKLAALGRRIHQRVVPAGTAPDQLVEEVAAALESPGPAPAAVKEQIVLAEEGFRLLRVLLSRGHSDEADQLGALPLTPAPQRP